MLQYSKCPGYVMSLYCPVIIASYAVCAGMTEQKELVDG